VPVQTQRAAQKVTCFASIRSRTSTSSTKRGLAGGAEQNVRQLKASLDQATAAAEDQGTALELAQQNYDRQAELFEKKIIAQAR
jgi:multidrug resistance efflux pump